MNTTTTTMKLLITASVIFASSSLFASASVKKISKQEYVNQWKGVAVEQMRQHQIPASITMAQAILESASGNSELARKGNNHFGIKCHSWKGKKMYKDDDKKDDCFRVYKNAQQSFNDHSDFLTRYKRYAFLFNYKMDDYKSWAKGLKKAGYATNPKYPQLLIKIIEDLNLMELDRMNGVTIDSQPQIVEIKVEEKTVAQNVRLILSHPKGVDYIVVKKGDTFYSLAKELGLSMAQMYRFNDFSSKKDFLEVGDLIYVQAKKKRNIFKKEEIVLSRDMTINEIAQENAIQAKTILSLNKLGDAEKTLPKGIKVLLR